MPSEMMFDRRVSRALMDALDGGWLAPLVERVLANPTTTDLQLHREPKGPISRACVYIGLTKVLEVAERNGNFRLGAHPTHRTAGGFASEWLQWQAAHVLIDGWPEITGYLDAITGGNVDVRWVRREGTVQARLCSSRSPDLRVISRECGLSFRNEATKASIVVPIADRVRSAVTGAGRSDSWWPGVRDRGINPAMGTEADVLAVDNGGRLLVVEAKPRSTDEVVG